MNALEELVYQLKQELPRLQRIEALLEEIAKQGRPEAKRITTSIKKTK